MLAHIPVRRIVFAAAGFLCTLGLDAATYLAGSDADLARRAPVIVRASVVSRETRLETVEGRLRPFTIVSLATLETIKGRVPEAFSVRLPGGQVGDIVSWVPGTPTFPAGAEVVLFLERAAGAPGMYRLTEFGLSKFDLVADEDGRRFAIRSVFTPRDDIRVADRGDVLARLVEKASVPARDAESFLEALRRIGAGREPGDIAWRERSARGEGDRRAKWVNIGGREPGDCGGGDPCLFRWFWDTGDSPDAVVTVSGTQTNLADDDMAPGCGMDSICDVQNGIDGWRNVVNTDVRYGGVAAGGNVSVALDATTDFNGGSIWTTPLGCGAGVIGVGGPGQASGPHSYRGDGSYFATQVGSVSMRKVTCTTGYSARTFKTAVMHEIGHTLGLGHPDDDGSGVPVESTHSSTEPFTWSAAVMTSVVAPSKPSTPQADDGQAIQYLYSTGPLGPLPTADFSYFPDAPTAGSPVNFGIATDHSMLGFTWTFGDPSSGAENSATSPHPSHAFSAPGTYTVTLAIGTAAGTGTVTKTLAVGQAISNCTPDESTLCLNDGRFSVRARYETNDQRSGSGVGVPLTPDSGYFYFFSASNIEVVVKVLNGCPVTNAYWVFAAGLTNVRVSLDVTDTRSGEVKSYGNPLDTAFAPVQDTSAFSTCP